MVKKILVQAASGIGNNLLLTPSLEVLKTNYPESEIFLIVREKGAMSLLENCPYLKKIWVVNYGLLKKPAFFLKIVSEIRKIGFDLCINVFPSDRLDKYLFSWLTGASIRLAHEYGKNCWKKLRFLANRTIPLDESIHDVMQNFNLIRAICDNTEEKVPELKIFFTEEQETWSHRFLVENNLTDKLLIGMHPGSSKDLNMDLKRWEIEKFAQLADRINQRYHSKTMIFGGPEESLLKRMLSNQMITERFIVDGDSLLKVANLIKQMSLFISNDSLLMNIASAVGVPTVGIFGPSDPVRTAPWKEPRQVIRLGVHCSPCWSFRNSISGIRCYQPYRRCLDDLTVDQAFQMIDPFIEKYLSASKVNAI